MEQLTSLSPILIAVIGVIVGLLLGIGLMMLVQRRQAGGRSVDELRSELEDYREKVSDHFATTSELFRDMTEKYRDVYNHLAASSQALCEDPMEHGRLEFTEAKPQVEDSTHASEQTSESPELVEEAEEVKIDPTELRAHPS